MENETQTPQGGQTIIVQQKDSGNGIGTAGFVLALLALIFSWIPVVNFLDWILWPLGVIFSIIGIFRKPKGLAIAGLVISFIGIIIIVTVLGAVASAF